MVDPLVIIGWKTGFKYISFLKLLRDHTGLNLEEAKRLVDDLVEGASLTVEFGDEVERSRFREAAEQFGVVTKHEARG